MKDHFGSVQGLYHGVTSVLKIFIGICNPLTLSKMWILCLNFYIRITYLIVGMHVLINCHSIFFVLTGWLNENFKIKINDFGFQYKALHTNALSYMPI